MNATEEFSIPFADLTVICRLCLRVNEKLYQLFRSEEIETSAVPLSMKVTLCSAIRMSKNDILPQKICQNCFDYVNEWFQFRKKCIRNDAYLKKFLLSQLEKQEGKPKETTESIKYCNNSCDGSEVAKLNVQEESGIQTSHLNNTRLETTSNGEELILTSLEDSLNNESELDKINISMALEKPALKVPTEKFKCPSCPDSFYFLKDLKVHKSVIHRTVRTEKLPVKESLNLDDNLKLEKINVRAQYEMKCCEKIFFSKARFRKHYNKKHPGEKPYMCETCGKKDFISEETLKRHKILHTGKYRCEICSKTFTCNAILIIHKRDKHEDDKPFICDVCGKRFVTELLMNYHKRFHTGEKKYVCEECGLAVVTSSSLAKHKRIHSNIKPHICQVCGKGFIIKGRLVEHLRVHTGERPYSCHICHKGFTRRDKLKRHVRIHSGEKLFSCEYCGNNYSTGYGLTVHLKSHIVRNY